ncbi:MAG TPA: hypothetical protein VGQ59_20110 [Cyclobacteriaceae bacterium]|jgi:hypothetical protein|nr:hypothetical protein [Cyclobacteriaceae bacterium]
MKPFIFLIFLIIPSLSFAQTFPFEEWHDGKVVLESGDTLKGAIKYDLNDLLQVRHQNQMESFSARKVLLFEFFDQGYKRYRTFYSLPYSTNGSYKSPVFFEVLTEGKITTLSREKVEFRTYGYSPFMYGSYNTRKVLVNLYYLLKENGNIQDFSGKRSDWLDLMGNQSDDVLDYAKENKLDFDRKYDLKRIIDYYNSLFN